MTGTYEHQLGLISSYVHNAAQHQTHAIYQVLSKTALSKYSFIGNKGPLSVWTDRKAKKW